MVPWLVLGTVLLIPSAAFLLWGWRNTRAEMALMQSTETTPAADVAILPAGSVVEVKGKLRCANPLTAELSKAPCAHFASSVERHYEILEYDANRKTSHRVRKTQLVQYSALFAPFEIVDESGSVLVRPENAIVEGIEAVDRYDAQQEDSTKDGDGNRTLGFRYKETHLPVDVDVYVLGVAGADRAIEAPADDAKGQRFIVSINSEEARAAELGRRSAWMLGLGIGCLAGAALCLGSAAWLARHGLNLPAPPQEFLQGETW